MLRTCTLSSSFTQPLRSTALRCSYASPSMSDFQSQLQGHLLPEQLSTDPLRLLAYGSDASFYRLIPQLVVHLRSEEEVRRILPLAQSRNIPITFRAAGTSLSGQAVTDSVLLKLSAEHWKKHKIIHSHDHQASHVLLQPGLLGGEANRLLAKYHRKIGPDPSSIDSCMVGGIVSNNSSGMCCGVAENSYHTLSHIRLVFADGSVLDTADPASVEEFRRGHAHLIQGIENIRDRIREDNELCERIKRKFQIKCTTGYSLNAFVDYEDPIEIIKHIIVGSEGTLAFISNMTMQTVPDHPIKQTSLVIFPDFYQACDAATILKQTGVVNAAEIMDRKSLRSAEIETADVAHDNKELRDVMSTFVNTVKHLDDNAAALLLEIKSETEEELEHKTNLAVNSLLQSDKKIETVQDITFTRDPVLSKYYWDIRKGLVPLVGGKRATGSTYLMEDVATDVRQLAPMGLDIKEIFHHYGYHDATLFGHALDGNFHLAFSQNFYTPKDIDQYRFMMDDLCQLVAKKYDGSLKAEHGTGRNVAPFVELEWGTKAYQIMWDIKRLFDPQSILNPGVVLNENPTVHIENLKPMPAAHPIIDKCIECGFCESVCPSRNVTLTPRQRIVSYREISRLEKSGEDPARLRELKKLYEYDGFDTCAADGMCSERCPVQINTGSFVKDMRSKSTSPMATSVSMFIAKNFQTATNLARFALTGAHWARSAVGENILLQLNSAAKSVSPRGLVPQWNKYFPLANFDAKPSSPAVEHAKQDKVVYFSSCAARTMGPNAGNKYDKSVYAVTCELLEKAQYEVITPQGVDSLCCGMAFGSKGLQDADAYKKNELLDRLLEASEDGKYPILCETSPCLMHLREAVKGCSSDKYASLAFSLYEPVSFISNFLEKRLEWNQVYDDIMLHVPCSSKKMKLHDAMTAIAKKCSANVTDSHVSCCGMAGDRGMRYPELSDSATKPLKRTLEQAERPLAHGFSTSRTCEMQMANQSSLHFSSLLHLVNEATTPKSQEARK